jgi:hypothetical protein
MTILRERGQHLRPVGKKQGVADIEENDASFSHESILLKASD